MRHALKQTFTLNPAKRQKQASNSKHTKHHTSKYPIFLITQWGSRYELFNQKWPQFLHQFDTLPQIKSSTPVNPVHICPKT